MNSVPLSIAHAEKRGDDQIMVALSDGTFFMVTLRQVLTLGEVQPKRELSQQEK